MNTSFEFFNPYTLYLDSDHPSFYHIKTYDNGLIWRLYLVHTASDEIVDTLSLEGRCHLDNINPIWHDHKVIQSVFNRADYIDDAPQDVLDTIKAQMEANNQMTVVEFLKDHNDSWDRYDEVMFKHAIAEGQRIMAEGV